MTVQQVCDQLSGWQTMEPWIAQGAIGKDYTGITGNFMLDEVDVAKAIIADLIMTRDQRMGSAQRSGTLCDEYEYAALHKKQLGLVLGIPHYGMGPRLSSQADAAFIAMAGASPENVRDSQPQENRTTIMIKDVERQARLMLEGAVV